MQPRARENLSRFAFVSFPQACREGCNSAATATSSALHRAMGFHISKTDSEPDKTESIKYRAFERSSGNKVRRTIPSKDPEGFSVASRR
jgi:hypothetical protein